MANTITALANTMFAAARKTPNELTGILGACTRDFNDQGASKGDTVKVSVVPTMTSSAFTASQTFTAGANRTISTKSLALANESQVSWHWTGEEERQLANGGVGSDVAMQTFQQAFRTMRNEIESYAWLKARAAASRGVGTAGTAPFGSTINILNSTKQLMLDNGVAEGDQSLVINTAAGTNLRNLGHLYKANEAGSAEMLRQGIIGNLSGFNIRESAAVVSVTAGTGSTTYVTNTPAAATLAVGTTTIGLDTGSGTILAGDVITFTGDTNKYVVTTGITAAGDIVIAEPGLRQTLADGVASAVGAAASANIAMHRSGLVTVVRPSLQPEGGGHENMVVTDPDSGLSYLVTRSVGHGLASWYTKCVYDCFAPNPYAINQLLG
ncbi:MAG: hypothetical protein WC069_06530 [Candidatus Shapirobacteria bacterium]